MITLHGEEVKVGDEVWDVRRGWGEVIHLEDDVSSFSIYVSSGTGREWYTKDGRVDMDDVNPTLFWQPIVFEIPKKPYREKT